MTLILSCKKVLMNSKGSLNLIDYKADTLSANSSKTYDGVATHCQNDYLTDRGAFLPTN